MAEKYEGPGNCLTETKNGSCHANDDYSNGNSRRILFNKLKRIIAYYLRWRSNALKSMKTCSIITAEEPRKPSLKWYKQSHFCKRLGTWKRIEKYIVRVNYEHYLLVLDNEGLIRIGGRLQNAAMSEDQKHQIILPAKHFITNLIMKSEHVRLYHVPPSSY